MNKKELEAFAREAAKGMKTEKDLNEFSQMLTKVAVEAALNAELDDHLGYSKHETSSTENSRNGFTSKTLRTEDGLACPVIIGPLAVLGFLDEGETHERQEI